MNRLRKKVLIVSYYFPPAGGAGVQRTLKFVKYLPEFGWEPVILTARNADYPAYDESLQSEIPQGIKVYRSRIAEPYRLYRKLTGRPTDEATDIATLTLKEHEKRKFSEQLSEWLRAAFFVPDARIAWLFFAFLMGIKILRQEKIDVIYSSAPPYTTHLIGMMLHRFSQRPWVADFRDSWIGWLSAPQWRPKFSRKLETWMERSVLFHANRILHVSQGVKEDLLSRHPEMRDNRWQFLPNGFDADDLKNVKPMPKDEKITFTYTGSLYGNRNPEYLLRTLEKLQQTNSTVLEKIRFRFVGRVGQSIFQRIEDSSVSRIIEVVSYVSHQESLAYLLGSDISLLIIDDAPMNRGILTGKLFEYIGAGHPIFALAPEGEAADLIRSKNLGIVVAHKEIKAIQDALHLLIQVRRRKKQQTDLALRTQFERRHLTSELADILEEL
jgi:hypothetical protein